MKKTIFLLFLIIAIGCSEDDQSEANGDPAATTFPDKAFFGDVVLITQDDVDLFGQENYTVVNGDLRIKSQIPGPVNPRVVDLSPLIALKEVKGDLEITGYMNNLEGLNNLENVEGRINGFRLVGPELQNVDALSSLVSIGGHLTILGVENLQNINGLSNLNSVFGCRFTGIRFNDFSPLEMESIREFIIAQSNFNGSLTFHPGLTSFNTFEIRSCSSVTNLDFLENISIMIRFNALYNGSLTDFCGIRQTLPLAGYSVEGNAFNPTQTQILNGDCSL